jgi:hypothetical protein
MRVSNVLTQRHSRPALVFAGVGVAVALYAFACLAVFETPPGAPLTMALLKIFDPFLRFPSGGETIFLLSFVFNALYYFGVGLVSQGVLRKHWPFAGKIVLIGAAAGALNISLQAMFTVCEYLLTGRIFAT